MVNDARAGGSVSPPDEHQVAFRALCLGAVIARGEFEAFLEDEPEATPERLQQLITRLGQWLATEGVQPHLSAAERLLLQAPLGKWTQPERRSVSWRIEALGVLLWALTFVDRLLPYDTEFDDVEVMETLGLYRFAPIDGFLEDARLRAASEVQVAREAAALWHWRANVARLQEAGTTPADGRSWAEIISDAAATACRRGWAPEPIGDDLPVFGKPYGALSLDERYHAYAIAVERHRALNWLCGSSPDWDQVPLAT
ncbi:MAG: DUF4272 domain-containing protein [Armatimonadetes bacterium]|nr:DUF4272 domain-containing protein [Armatimonadota bacterium]